jgi:hypothetical protein
MEAKLRAQFDNNILCKVGAGQIFTGRAVVQGVQTGAAERLSAPVLLHVCSAGDGGDDRPVHIPAPVRRPHHPHRTAIVIFICPEV